MLKALTIILLFFNIQLKAKTLFDKQNEINKLWEESLKVDKEAIIGIDIGGSKIDWGIYPINGDLEKKSIYSEKISTPKGLINLTNCYYNILLKAINVAKSKGFYIKAVGIGSPGRFIEYRKQNIVMDNLIIEEIGNPFIIESSLFSISNKNTIAKGTAENLSQYPGEFDGVILESVLQRLSPKYVRVVVNNDAGVQLQALTNTIADKGNLIDKKVIYLGLGTGLGTAIMNPDGKLVTDGHFQYIKISKLTQTLADSEVYNIIRDKNKDKYNKVNSVDDVILPEDIFSSAGIGNILKNTFNIETLPDHFDDIIYKEGKESDIVKQRLQSIGKYMGYFLATLRSGNFNHLDPDAEWPAFDKAQIRNFSTIILGGGIVKDSKFFQDFILPEVKKVLENLQSGDKIDIIMIQSKKADINYAAAKIAYDLIPHSTPDVYLTFDDGPDPMYTDKILEILNKYNIKATFFVVGQMVDRHPNILKRTAEQGHTIGIHTYTHPNLIKLSDEKIRLEIQKSLDAVKKVLPDYKVKHFRPPYGAIDSRVRKIIKSFDLDVVLWNSLGSEYLKIATPSYIKYNINMWLKRHNGGIVLLHDGGGSMASGKNPNPKFRVGKQNVIDYLEMDLPNLTQKYTLKPL